MRRTVEAGAVLLTKHGWPGLAWPANCQSDNFPCKVARRPVIVFSSPGLLDMQRTWSVCCGWKNENHQFSYQTSKFLGIPCSMSSWNLNWSTRQQYPTIHYSAMNVYWIWRERERERKELNCNDNHRPPVDVCSDAFLGCVWWLANLGSVFASQFSQFKYWQSQVKIKCSLHAMILWYQRIWVTGATRQ